jgi:hypothetical protein
VPADERIAKLIGERADVWIGKSSIVNVDRDDLAYLCDCGVYSFAYICLLLVLIPPCPLNLVIILNDGERNRQVMALVIILHCRDDGVGGGLAGAPSATITTRPHNRRWTIKKQAHCVCLIRKVDW